MDQMRDNGLGVPPPHPFAPQGYAREQAGSGFPLYSSAGLPACGVPLQSVTRRTHKCPPHIDKAAFPKHLGQVTFEQQVGQWHSVHCFENKD